MKITVIGAVNIDILGTPSSHYIPTDSNPGKITVSVGGVGYNIARNCAANGCEVSLIAPLGDDGYLDTVRCDAASYGVDIANCPVVKGAATSTYMYITDENGETVSAINDMSIISTLGQDFLKSKLEMINSSDALVIDANLTSETLEFIARNVKVPIFCDPVSASKAPRLIGILGYITAIKPNLIEASALTGIDTTSENGVKEALNVLLSAGVGSVYITLGKDGVIAGRKDEIYKLDSKVTDPVNTNGAGDAFTAAVIMSEIKGLTLKESAEAGLLASKEVTNFTSSVFPPLSEKR